MVGPNLRPGKTSAPLSLGLAPPEHAEAADGYERDDHHHEPRQPSGPFDQQDDRATGQRLPGKR